MKNIVGCLLALTLATRLSAAIITVTTTNNVSPGTNDVSLLQALNTVQDGDTIQFNIPGTGPAYIPTPVDGYPLVTNNNITIDGYSQPGAAPNTNSILDANNARIRIVLDSRAPAGGRTLLGGLNNPGYGATESAMLGVFGAKNFKIRGVSFLSRQTTSSSEDPDIYCIALINDATNAQISGCWFGVDPNGTNVAGGRSSVAAFTGDNGTTAAGLVIGTNGDGTNDVAEFNVHVGMALAINLQTPNVKLAGNLINVLPDGRTFFDVTRLGLPTVEAIENGQADNMVIGTDGDGVSDDLERNVIGPVLAPAIAKFWAPATNITFAGNYVGLTFDGHTCTNASSLVDLHKQSDIRIGSTDNGTNHPIEANWIDNLTGPFLQFEDDNNDPGATNSVAGWDVAKAVVRGNVLNNLAAPVPIGPGQNVGTGTFYAQVLQDATSYLPVLSTNTTRSRLIGSIPAANTNNYPYSVIDLYLADSAAETNGVQIGRSYLGSFVDNSAADSDPTPNQFSFDISQVRLPLGGNVDLVIAVTYSQDPTNTASGRAVTSPFSNAIRVSQATLPPLRITSVSLSKTNLALSWTNGVAPFQVQSTTNLSNPTWQTTQTVTNTNTVSVPVSGRSVFFRVQGQ